MSQDYIEAVKWYRLAANQGYAAAQFNLGVMYAHGQGLPQNDAEALKWYRLAANQGYAAAQLNLGNMYANGRGVPKDYITAHMWLGLAMASGRQDAAKIKTNRGNNNSRADRASAEAHKRVEAGSGSMKFAVVRSGVINVA